MQVASRAGAGAGAGVEQAKLSGASRAAQNGARKEKKVLGILY